MIKGVHAMFYAPNADELRAFLRDKLGLAYSDVGDGWLIFDVPEGEVGCHPAERSSHGISFFCDDIHRTVNELKGRGVEFSGGVTDQGWGLAIKLRMPGGGEVELYQPQYQKRAKQVRGFRAMLMVGAVETAPHRLELASGIWFETSEDDARVLRATALRVTEPAPPPATAPATRPGPNR